MKKILTVAVLVAIQATGSVAVAKGSSHYEPAEVSSAPGTAVRPCFVPVNGADSFQYINANTVQQVYVNNKKGVSFLFGYKQFKDVAGNDTLPAPTILAQFIEAAAKCR